MTKRQLIDEIVAINHSARPGFLARFDDSDLDDYLQHLRLAESPRLSGNPHRFDHFFESCPKIPLSESDRRARSPADDTSAAIAENAQDDRDSAAESLHISPQAYFKESYEAKAS